MIGVWILTATPTPLDSGLHHASARRLHVSIYRWAWGGNRSRRRRDGETNAEVDGGFCLDRPLAARQTGEGEVTRQEVKAWAYFPERWH